MAGFLDTIARAVTPGRKVYKTESKIPPFAQMDLKEKLQAIVYEKRIQEKEKRQRLNLNWYVSALYYRGHQQIGLNASGSGLDVYEDSDYYIENQFRRHVDTVVQILNKQEGDLVVRPASDNPRDIATARVADPVLDMQLTDIGYERVKQQKNFYKALFGNAFVFSDFIRDKKYGSIVTPRFSYEEMSDEFGDPLLSKVVSGYEKRNKGKQICTVCSPLEINCPLDITPFTEIPYLQWISRQDEELIEYLYPGIKLDGGSDISHDIAQQYIETLQNLPGNLLGDGVRTGGSTQRKLELVRSWLKPCTFKGDKELKKEFPDGVQVTTVNGLVVDYYNEDLNDRWTHEVLIPVPHSLAGDGLYDAILEQDQINESDSLIIKHLRYSTVGHKAVDTNAMDPKDWVNDPKNGLIPFKIPLDKRISDVIQDLPPSQLSGDVAAWLQLKHQTMQDMTGAYDPESGKSTGANTPYSQSVFLAEKAQGRWKNSKDYNYPERVRFHVNLLEDVRNNWVDMRQKAVVDNTGQWSFEQFSQADIQGNVDISFSDEDNKPRTRAEQVQAMSMLPQMLPLIAVLPPKQKLRVEEMMGLPADANPMSNQIARAYRMIDRMKKGEEVMPLPLVDDPTAQMPVFQDYLVSEEGEALGESDPETFANIFSYMMTLLQFGMKQMGSPGGQLAGQVMGKKPPGEEGAAGPIAAGGPKGQPGGQLGQKGGAGGGKQPNAQTPAQPAPPVAAPSPS